MSWGGVPLNLRTAAMMDEAQILYGATITATQGSPNPGGVGASAGTHDGEGVIDVVGADLDAIVIAMRMVGFAAWHRTPAQGFTPHVHGVAVGEPLLSSQAANQVAAYYANLNGLRSNLPDDGPRTWVGVTWETYGGGAPLDPGPERPVGHPFWGESRPPEDWTVLTGSADRVFADGTPPLIGNAAASGAAQAWGEDDGTRGVGDDYVRVPSAAKLLWIFHSSPTYLKADDDVTISWLVRARGAGSLSVTNDRDTSWAYTSPAGGVIGTATVASGTWVEHQFTTTAYTVADLLDVDGGYRVAVDVTGAVDIDVIQMRIWPPDGLIGDWTDDQASPDQEIEADSGQRFTSSGYSNYLRDGVSPQPADWEAGWSEAVTSPDDFVSTGGTLGGGASAVSNLWSLVMTATPIAVTPSAPPLPGTPDVDYMRRPDRTYVDANAYFQSLGTSAIVAWLNNYASLHVDIDDFATSAVVAKLPWQPMDLAGTTVVPVQLGGAMLVTIPLSTPTLTGLGLGLGDTEFLLTVRGTSWDDPGPDLGNGPWFEQFQIYLGVADFDADPDTWLPLTAVVSVPDFQLWQPGRWPGDLPDDPDGNPVVTITWLRQRQRNDGLGNSITRARSVSSQQNSLRQRGYR